MLRKLISCGIKGHSVKAWIVGLEQFSKFLYAKLIISESTFNTLGITLNNYNRRSDLTQRSKNVINRQKYLNITEKSSTFSWIKEREKLITSTLNNTIPVSSDEINLFISYISGLILHLGHRPQVVTNFTIEEYKQGQKNNTFFISNIKSQETGIGAFKLQNEKEQSMVQFYYDNIRQFGNSYDNFLHTKELLWLTLFSLYAEHYTNTILQVRILIQLIYRHIVATKIQENVEDPEIRKHLHQEINQTEVLQEKYIKDVCPMVCKCRPWDKHLKILIQF